MIVWRGIGAGVVALVVAAALTPLPNTLARAMAVPPREEQADAIVALGSGRWPGGELTDASMRRALHAIVLYRRGLAPLVVFTGPPGDGVLSEAAARGRLAASLGVPASAVALVEDARTTHEEAMRVRALLGPHGGRRVLVVSDALHLGRAARAFAHAGLEPLPAPAGGHAFDEIKPHDRLVLLRRVVLEAAARLYYRLAGFV